MSCQSRRDRCGEIKIVLGNSKKEGTRMIHLVPRKSLFGLERLKDNLYPTILINQIGRGDHQQLVTCKAKKDESVEEFYERVMVSPQIFNTRPENKLEKLGS